MITIPKIIHYCWFGGNPLPKDAVECINTWKKILPEYQIMEWNESNFSINDAPVYVQEAYKEKKFAFVSDYARILALYEYGGIYFDTDLEVLKRFDDCLESNSLVLAFEYKELLMTAFIACEKKHPFIKAFIDTYEGRHFIQQDGSYDTLPNTDVWSPLAASWGVDLKKNAVQSVEGRIKVYPIDYFTAYDIENCHEKITKNSRTVHHMANSWASGKIKFRNKVKHTIQRVISVEKYDKLRLAVKKYREDK